MTRPTDAIAFGLLLLACLASGWLLVALIGAAGVTVALGQRAR